LFENTVAGNQKKADEKKPFKTVKTASLPPCTTTGLPGTYKAMVYTKNQMVSRDRNTKHHHPPTDAFQKTIGCNF
jgi:hypothetical protein